MRIEVALQQPRGAPADAARCAGASATSAFEQPVTLDGVVDEDGGARSHDPARAAPRRSPGCGGRTATASRTCTTCELALRRRRPGSRTRSPSRPACGSSPTARRAARCGSGSTAGASSAAAATGASPSRSCATAAREYDVAVRYHRDMNFTMIRNWVGPDRRRRVLRGLRPARHRRLAGLLARQPVRRARPRRRRPVPAQRARHRAAHPQPSLGRALLRAQRRLPAAGARRRDARAARRAARRTSTTSRTPPSGR